MEFDEYIHSAGKFFEPLDAVQHGSIGFDVIAIEAAQVSAEVLAQRS